MSFGVFNKCFSKDSFSSLPIYKDAIFQIIEVTNQFSYLTLFKPDLLYPSNELYILSESLPVHHHSLF